MKYIITSVISFLLFWSSVFTVPFEEVESAFAAGDAEKIMTLGTTKVLISIDGKEGVYSKSQGTQVLTNFFKANPIKSFQFNFKGKEEVENSYAVGRYQSNKDYRVSLKFKKEGEDHLIEAITITAFSR
ncbi:MAG: DUF4783 domain-containing protein [Brumimicrobium sp.]